MDSITMLEQAGDRTTVAHELLEKGFQRCLKLTQNLQDQLKKEVEKKAGPRAFCDDEVTSYLKHFLEVLYGEMARTLFDLVRVLQPEDCGNEPVNFYFWPGYVSYLLEKRIFIEFGSQKLGVGICEPSKTSPYYDCSQANLYPYLLKSRNGKVRPIDIHRMFLQTSADQNSDRLSKSLTVTTEPLQRAVDRPDLLELTQSTAGTEIWGQLLVEKLKSIKGCQVVEKDPFLSGAAARMQSVWLHAAFCSNEPPWLDRFIEELKGRKDTEDAGLSLEEALKDKTVTHWGDSETGRPVFRSWISLSLRPWLNPLAVSLTDDPWMGNTSELREKTVGSAELLCSVPIRPQYLAFARAWISEVYNTVRSVEMAIVVHNQRLASKEALMAGPYFAHEIQTVIDQSLATALRNFADNRQEAIEARRYTLYSIKTLCTLAYSFANAILSNNKKALEGNKEAFIKPLEELRNEDRLLDDLTCIAKETHRTLRPRNGGTVIFNDSEEIKVPPNDPPNEAQHGACFLLTAEMLRNYCKSHDSNYEAVFRSWLENNEQTLILELAGPTRAQRNPRSRTLYRIDTFLKTLGVGNAHTAWDSQEKSFRFTITVHLGPKVLPSPSELSN